MLKEGVQAGGPFMLPAGDRKAAGYGLLPGWGVAKACAPVGRLNEGPGLPVFVENLRVAWGQSKVGLPFRPRCIGSVDMNKS